MDANTAEVRNCLCLQSRRAARNLTQIYDQALRQIGLRITQFQLLAAVGEAQPVTQQTLSLLMGMDRTTLTRNLGLLKRDKFIHIEAGSNDRRERVHRLTAKGVKMLADAFPIWRATQESIVEALQKGPDRLSRLAIAGQLKALGNLPAEILRDS